MRGVSKVLLLCLLLCALLSVAVPAMADDAALKELGTMVLDDWSLAPTWCGLHDQILNFHGFRDKLRTELASHGGWSESSPFPLNNAAPRAYMLTTSAGMYADSVDLFVFTGHAYTEGGVDGNGAGACPDGGSALHFIGGHVSGMIDVSDCRVNVNHPQINWGGTDVETSIIVACEWLRNFGNANLTAKIKKMHGGDHLMLSFATHCYDGTDTAMQNAGIAFAHYAEGVYPYDPLPIYSAWHNTVKIWQPSGTVSRVSLWVGDCYNDYLQGNWRGWGFGGQPPDCTDDNLSQFQFSDYTV